MRVVRKEVRYTVWFLIENRIREQCYASGVDYVLVQVKFEVNRIWIHVRLKVCRGLQSQ